MAAKRISDRSELALHPWRAPRVLIAAALLLFPFIARADDAATRPAASLVSAERLAAEGRFRALLRRPVSLDVKGESLERTLASVSRQAGVPIKLEWDDPFIHRPGGGISLRLQNVPADRVLALVLRCATDAQGTSAPKLYVDADGAHIVGDVPQSGGDQPVKTVGVAYDVADLVRAIRTGGYSTENCFDDLNRLIQITVAPESWLEMGGQVGKIRVAPLHPPPPAAGDDPDNPPSGGSDPRDPLVVTTTPEIQRQVAALLSGLRNGLAGQPPVLPAGVVRTAAELRRAVPATFRLLPLGGVLDSIRRSARLNLFVDWLVLSQNGITPDTLVSTPVPPNGMLPAGDALSAVFKALVESNHAQAGFDVDNDGVVEVYLASQPPEQEAVTCCFNIRALLQSRTPTKLWAANSPVDARADAIATVLDQQVAPDTWKENGGSIGTIKIIGCVMIIVQTPANQERIAEILQRMR